MLLASSRPEHHCLKRLLYSHRPSVASRPSAALIHFNLSLRRGDNAAAPKLQPAYATIYKPFEHTAETPVKSSSPQRRHNDTTMQLKLDEMLLRDPAQKEMHNGTNGVSQAAALHAITKGKQPKRAKNIKKGKPPLIPNTLDPNPAATLS